MRPHAPSWPYAPVDALRDNVPMATKLAKDFRSFADLAAAYERDRDYRIVQLQRPGSDVAIVAPHGGSIEAHTSDIARDIAGQDFNLYLFEGLLKAGNFAALHLSSALFDEPACLALLAHCKQVVSVHGCGHAGEVVLLGGGTPAFALRSLHVCTPRVWTARTRLQASTRWTPAMSATAG